MISRFLQFKNHHVRVDVTGQRVSRGVGLGFETCKLLLDNELHVKVEKCVKQKHASVSIFSQPIKECPLLGGKFSPKYSLGAQKNVRNNKCSL